MPEPLPTGTVTFLFTDIEGSTARWELHAEAMSEAIHRHDHLTKTVVESAGGDIFKSTGDGFCSVFAVPSMALSAALDLRSRLESEAWPQSVAPLRVRMAIHSGPAEQRASDYFGPTLNRTARLMAAGHGGQILVSEAVHQLISDTAMLRDLGVHRLRDLLQPERIYQLSDDEEVHDPLRGLDSKSHNLPVQVTSFVGRERDIAELTVLIDTTRLVTLTGPGGTGKTRLALQAGAEVVGRFDSVHFVPLANAAQADRIPAAIADVVGLQDRSARSAIDILAAHLEGRRDVLILDNFEHLMEGAPLVGELLDRTTDLHVVVTSRELLRLRAENHYPVAPLGVPTTGPVAAKELADFEAIRLFTERARAASADFSLDDANGADVAALCEQLDGLPLAIELAAARIRLFSPSELRSRLAADQSVLGSGPVDAPQRQRTLVDTITWSYDLLDPEEQALFRRLAVFGGASLDAVEAIASPGLSLEALTAVEALIDKSLVQVDQGRLGEFRVDLLGTIHGFAFDQLQAHGEVAEFCNRHAKYFADLAQAAAAELRGPKQLDWTQRLEDERPNFEAAMDWTLGSGNPTHGLQIVGGLRDFWFYRGHFHEMGRWVQRAMPLIDSADPKLKADVLMTAGFHLYMGHEEGDAYRLLDDAAQLYAAAGAYKDEAMAKIWAAGSRERISNIDETTRRAMTEALATARAADSPSAIAQALNMLGEMERSAGNLELAWEIQQEGLVASHVAGEPMRVAMMTHNLGLIAQHLENYDEADRLIRRSLDLAMDQDFRAQACHSLIAAAEQLARRGDPEKAARLIGCADRQFDLMGFRAQPADEPDYTRIRAYVSTTLGAERYQEAVSSGAALQLEEAADLVRATEDS